ncbi:MAG: 50S ribosomal protein L27 [Candidatus Shapirobacteria bacterium]|jgi:large subunit ribosomal protein L27
MAHVKSQGKTNQKSNRPGQRRGLKKFGDQKTEVGQIIVRQVGSKFHPGIGTKQGKDFTIYAMRPGVVKFFKKLGKKFVSVVKAPPKSKKIEKKAIEHASKIVKAKYVTKKAVVEKVAVKATKKTVKKSISKK